MEQPFQPSAPQAIYGIQIADPTLARLTKRVMCLAAAAAVFAVISGIVNLTVNTSGASGISGAGVRVGSVVVGVGLALLVPACGYFGAKNEDSNLACCFCGLNCFGSFCNGCNIVLAVVGYMGVKTLLDNCDYSDPTGSCPATWDWSTACAKIAGHENDTGRQCFAFYEDLADKMKNGLPFVVGLTLPTLLLQCCSFAYGSKFYNHLKNRSATPAVPVLYATQAIPGQPALRPDQVH